MIGRKSVSENSYIVVTNTIDIAYQNSSKVYIEFLNGDVVEVLAGRVHEVRRQIDNSSKPVGTTLHLSREGRLLEDCWVGEGRWIGVRWIAVIIGGLEGCIGCRSLAYGGVDEGFVKAAVACEWE